MSPTAHAALACTSWIAIWWVTEAIPIAVTSLMPLIIYPLMDVMDIRTSSDAYSNSYIYLFLGGFMLAIAMEKWNLHRRIALKIIYVIGTNMRQMVLGFMLATGFLSMWISNTATTVMMLPVALSIIVQFKIFNEKTDKPIEGSETFPIALILALPYAASIGGIATLVGTPTNLIFVESVDRLYGTSIPFDEWFAIGFPVSIILLAICWLNMTRFSFKLSNERIPGSRTIIQNELNALGPMSYEEKWVLGVFSSVAFCWITRSYLITPIIPALNDTVIVLIGATLLFIIPSSLKGEKIMDWQSALKLPWGVLLLFGGAFAVAAAFAESGLTLWIGAQLASLSAIPFWIALLIVVTAVNFLTEITQNVATCTLMMPIMAALAAGIGVHPFPLMAATCMASTCAFMLPVATPPNAVVFGSGYIKMKDMVRAGFVMNLLSIVVVVIIVYFLLPLVWGIDLTTFPMELNR